MDIGLLIEAAKSARDRAYAPYSGFHVGAAVLVKDGRIFSGCNVENLSFGLSLCAERNALFGAIAAGSRDIVHVVVVADTTEPVSPCGACRQVISEFSEIVPVTSVTLSGVRETWSLEELLPRPRTGILEVPRGT